ncbi:hypothetical protein Pst134EA_025444 [Puccinia striiformis f. sp. tritici]|uniref:hypothetical protein n=1 Tax=Puccinia striiformis f. sp. tritici TaxID=168172 RepID=UPI002007354C|nr:hypothetical protein Pst134EA_025444 [Puccinia striiformis f. sp. tritici]KAH9451489.1 hypothetical protein Pst134EA_025444 [Puccinia striiformis f. sp. tritici]
MPIRRGYVWRPDEPSDNESEEHSEERDEGQMSDNRSEGQDEGHNIEGRRDDQILSPVPHRGEGGKSPKQANAIRRPKALGNPIGSEPRAAKRLRSMSGFTETDAL